VLGARPRTLVIYWGPLTRVFCSWSQTKNPSHLLGALNKGLLAWHRLLGPRPNPQECTGGPRSQLGSLPSSQRMALADALNSTLPLSKRGILSYTKLVTKVYKLCQGQWLGKNICRLFCRRNILNAENVLLNHVPDIVVSHLNVFQFVVKHWILGELYTSLNVTVNDCRFKL
jgi:hypothetical protein